ncbi:MAG: transcriptional regulator, partial [Microcystis aeruginosa]
LEEYLSEYRRFAALVPARFCEENQ